MEAHVDLPLIASAVAMLAVAFWAAITSTRVGAWCVTATLLWLGTASFAASALFGSPLAFVLLGWSLTVAALVVAAYALLGRPAGAKRAAPVEIRHVVSAR